MLSESFEIAVPAPPQVVIPAPVLNQVLPGPALASPEQLLAADQVFASQPRDTVADGMILASAGMLLHDIVKDTLAPAKEQEEEDEDEERTGPK